MDILQLPPNSLGGGEQTPQLSLNEPVPRSGNAGASTTPTTTAAQRKKFAKPPVKNACLSCRGSRIRCDGQRPCLNCTEKHKDCKYEKSRRGGPRVPSRKQKENRNASAEEQVKQESPPQLLSIEDQFYAAQEMREAGAGLRLLDDLHEDMAFLDAVDKFDNCGANALDDIGIATIPDAPEEAAAFDFSTTAAWDPSNEFSVADENVPSEVRSYESEANTLDAYYVWIHAYFPVLPPPLRAPIDRPYIKSVIPNAWMPTTPITLALSAILALIPLPDDPNARSQESTWDRRFQAQKYAQAAFSALDNETEMLDSSFNPGDALSNGPSYPNREPFHPHLPLDLEANVTLMLLAVYEYTQRGNIKKMMNRGGQSLMLALDAKLFDKVPWDDPFAEARKRVWWATYINVCQGSIASNTSCAIDLYDTKFKCEFPTIVADPDAYPFFIRSQQAIVEATQYVIDHTELLKRGGDLAEMFDRTVELENRLAELSKTADAWFIYDRSPVDQPVDASEAVVAKTLRAIARMKINSARIKIHRYSAFIDQPIFQKRHCDLEPAVLQQQQQQQQQYNGSGMMASPSHSNTNSSPMDGSSVFSGSNREGSMSSGNTPLSSDCSNGGNISNHSHSHSHPPSARSYSSEIQPMCSLPAQAGPALVMKMHPLPVVAPRLPYSSTYSAQQCCKSAIDIAETFAMLPYPNPTGQMQSRNPVYNPADPLNPRNLTSTNYASPFGLPDMNGVGALNGGVGMNKSGGLDFSAVARQQASHPPRTMPTFACCAMQAAYALLMGLYGVYARRQNGQLGDLADEMSATGVPKPYGVREKEVRMHVERLREGLGGVVAALENWAGAFEAIDGMREEVSNALEYNVVQFDDLGTI